jgi:hypothetical protein
MWRLFSRVLAGWLSGYSELAAPLLRTRWAERVGRGRRWPAGQRARQVVVGFD